MLDEVRNTLRPFAEAGNVDSDIYQFATIPIEDCKRAKRLLDRIDFLVGRLEQFENMRPEIHDELEEELLEVIYGQK
tara:strand:- start:251 stop:481 length:231 start_codon:yes stop_codon:yes gene_type:complete